MLAYGGIAAAFTEAGSAGAEPSRMQVPSVADARAALAPSGKLRAAINYGNTVLAQKDEKTGALTGVTVVLARTLAARLGVPLEMIPFPAAGQVFEAMGQNLWDVAFMAVEPERAVKIDFSAPYVSIDGTYLVRASSPYRTVADLDKPGVRVSVARGAAYDLYLSRNLKNAEIVRGATGVEAVDMFLAGKERLDAAAGVRQFLADAARGKPDYRVLADRFSQIDQAMAVPRGRPPAGAAYVRAFVEEMKASGLVRKALDDTGQDAANVAPPAF